MHRYVMIRAGKVENVVLWDGEAEWHPGPDYLVLDSEDAQIGWLHDDEGFHPVEPVEE